MSFVDAIFLIISILIFNPLGFIGFLFGIIFFRSFSECKGSEVLIGCLFGCVCLGLGLCFFASPLFVLF